MKSTDSVIYPSESFSLAKLIDELAISEESVANDNRANPLLFLEAAKYRMQQMKRRTALESKVKSLRATLGAKIRSKIRDSGARDTNAAVEEQILQNSHLKKLEQKLEEVAMTEEFSKLLLEAFRLRRDALKVNADLVGAEMYVQKRMSGDTELDRMQTHLRQKLSEKYARPKRKKH